MNDLKEMLGYTGEDIITGFQGVITGVCAYIGGYGRVLLTPKYDGTGKSEKGRWVDTSRVKVLIGIDRVTLPKEKMEETLSLDKGVLI